MSSQPTSSTFPTSNNSKYTPPTELPQGRVQQAVQGHTFKKIEVGDVADSLLPARELAEAMKKKGQAAKPSEIKNAKTKAMLESAAKPKEVQPASSSSVHNPSQEGITMSSHSTSSTFSTSNNTKYTPPTVVSQRPVQQAVQFGTPKEAQTISSSVHNPSQEGNTMSRQSISSTFSTSYSTNYTPPTVVPQPPVQQAVQVGTPKEVQTMSSSAHGSSQECESQTDDIEVQEPGQEEALSTPNLRRRLKNDCKETYELGEVQTTRTAHGKQVLSTSEPRREPTQASSRISRKSQKVDKIQNEVDELTSEHSTRIRAIARSNDIVGDYDTYSKELILRKKQAQSEKWPQQIIEEFTKMVEDVSSHKQRHLQNQERIRGLETEAERIGDQWQKRLDGITTASGCQQFIGSLYSGLEVYRSHSNYRIEGQLKAIIKRTNTKYEELAEIDRQRQEAETLGDEWKMNLSSIETLGAYRKYLGVLNSKLEEYENLSKVIIARKLKEIIKQAQPKCKELAKAEKQVSGTKSEKAAKSEEKVVQSDKSVQYKDTGPRQGSSGQHESETDQSGIVWNTSVPPAVIVWHTSVPPVSLPEDPTPTPQEQKTSHTPGVGAWTPHGEVGLTPLTGPARELNSSSTVSTLTSEETPEMKGVVSTFSDDPRVDLIPGTHNDPAPTSKCCKCLSLIALVLAATALLWKAKEEYQKQYG